MDSYLHYDEADPRSELVQHLQMKGVPFLDEGSEVRFSLCDGAFQWETVCRFAPHTVMIYGVYPFLAADRLSAVLTDVYSAQEAVARALEYNAAAVRCFWEKMRACAE